MSRRLLIFAIVCACVAGCRGASGPSAIPQGPAGLVHPPATNVRPDYNVNELPEPPVVKAVNGVVQFQLIANVNPATGLPSFQYDGMHGVAPTIDVKPGQTFKIDLVDELPASGGLASDINLHFHGFGSSPKATGRRRAHHAWQSRARSCTTSCTFLRIKSRALLVSSARARRDELSSRREAACPARSWSRASRSICRRSER